MDADSWRQAKSVLEAALLCSPDERDALVAARCADPSLRREVLACLNEHDESFLESALTITNTFEHAASTDDVEAPPEVQPGERIGRYEVVGRIGAGGMGHVFLGNDTELQRRVALKGLIASASAADIRSRILHEARAAARINHPNIAVVHDVVEHDGRPFLVMEYVEGENLAQALKRERPPLEKILAIGRQLASALTAAHAKGIIHRDLKPANIQLMPGGSVKILDFGVAHAIALADVEPLGAPTAAVPLSTTMATLRTERGAIRHPGTPAYMSPEQMLGKPIDQRSDIFSLGVILYEMSTGHRPYSTDDPLDVVLALSRNLLRPSGAETHLPDAVNDVIGRMLAVELDQRYQTAAEVEAALAALMTPDASPAARPAARSRLRSIALSAATVLLVVPLVVTGLGFVTSAWFNYMLERQPPFSSESPAIWIEMGLRSLFGPAIFIGGVLFVLAALRFVVRILSLSKSVDSLLTASRARTERLSHRLQFDNPSVIGQAVAAAGLLLLGVVFWRFRDFLRAMDTRVSSEVNFSELVVPLRPHYLVDAGLCRAALQILMLFFSVSILRIARIRARQPVPQGAGALAMVVMLLLLTLLANELPYRLLYRNEFERISVAGNRCYAIGETERQVLAFCPDVAPQRNRTINRDSPTIVRSGVIESIFTPPESPH